MFFDPCDDQFAVISSIPSSASRQHCKHVSFKLTNYSQGNRTADRPKEAIAHSSTRQVKSAGSLVTGDDDDDGDYDNDDDDDQTSVTIPAEVAKYTTEYLTQILPQGQQTVHDNNRKDPFITLEL